MKVVIVNESVPYPPTAGNRIRTLNLMTRLARRHQITYLCRAGENEEETQGASDYLAERGIRMVVADEAPEIRKGAALYARLAGNVFSPRPYAVASHNSPAMRRAIADMARQGEADLWQFEWLAYADALKGTEVPSLVMAHNVESLIWKRYVQNETHSIRRLYLKGQWHKFRRYERAIFRKVSGVVCVSEEDARLARSEFPPQKLWVVENGIDREYFAATPENRREKTILFLGSLDWRPNQDAVRLLLEIIFPKVLDEEPGARLSIVGRRPPEWLINRVKGIRNVELHQDVPDVRPHLGSSTVMAVPLRVGGGSRLKILEAMACGTPVVSTPVGYEGLALEPRRDLRVAEPLDVFAWELVWCMRNGAEARTMAENARRLVYEHYDWDVLARKLESAWEEVVREHAMANPMLGSVQPAMG